MPHDAHLALAVERLHGAKAVFTQSVPVMEIYDGSVWEGIVHVFGLQDHPEAARAYAWSSSPVDGGYRRRFFAVLHIGAVKSPADAVRATIEAQRIHELKLKRPSRVSPLASLDDRPALLR
jgi:hypothetical protein